MKARRFGNLALVLLALLLTGVAAFMSACGSSSSSPTSSGGGVTPTNTPTTTCSVPNGGNVTTLAGTGLSGSANGTGVAASFSFPYGVAVDSSGNIYVADAYNNLIRKITSGGAVTTFAGSGSAGATNATGTSASFHNPEGVAVDSSGNVYVADTTNHLIRKITPARVVSTFAGTGSPGSNNGAATVATFNNPSGVAVDPSGNVYVADASNHLIRKITS